MKENKLTDALGMIGEDEICGYFEYGKALAEQKKRRVKAIFTRTVIAAALIIVFAFAMIPTMLRDNGEEPPLVADGTTEALNVTENTDPPVPDETSSYEEPPGDPNDRENVLIVEISDSAGGNEVRNGYITWSGLEISGLLEYGLKHYGSQTNKFFVINVFRRYGETLSDYLYEGKTFNEWCDEMSEISRRVFLVQQLIYREGEILKYGKEVITVTGIPTGDPLIDDYDEGKRWAERLYDETVSKYNEYDPEMLSRYIVDGDFLSELAESDLALFEAEYQTAKQNYYETPERFLTRHEKEDLALFESLGLKAGEVNGKLYIFATIGQLRGLAAAADMSAFSFTPLSYDDYLDAYPISNLPDDYTLDRTVSGFDTDKFVFSFLRREGEKNVDVTVSNDEELYCAIEETIHKYKRGSLYIELQFFADYLMDASELEGLKYSGYTVSKYSHLSAVKLRHEDFNDPEIMEFLRDLSLRKDIKRIKITQCFYVP